jgi:hypothetical protein
MPDVMDNYRLNGVHLLDGGNPTPERLALAIALLWEWTLVHGTQNKELAHLITAVYVNMPQEISVHIARMRGQHAQDD